ncbi:hypothetical protein [Novacetimonas maltaceti]|nr:hypothetical protein [Novacetimonas maltaceti]
MKISRWDAAFHQQDTTRLAIALRQDRRQPRHDRSPGWNPHT